MCHLTRTSYYSNSPTYSPLLLAITGCRRLVLDGRGRFGDSPEPGEPIFEKLNGANNFGSERDSDPDSEQEAESERRPEHARESRVSPDVLELLGRVVVEENTRAGEAE